ncbi:nuclease-related domain-containing DEAD/DEAH box helicase [Leptospira sp. GIMC2001]|uniref:nuclease-related domain-containing DEAD/DEAH box helicase n=1 Tax=Leptospira sp. GIMC2001 TaxID=1513297 RepID=UPI002349D1E7|nr:NERD domain-containing protein/DEAD/DEAH box helicase [Leptospira sp. GIMC2001]WCL50483.1 NERD domain-containing protein/DEAD/DEAH box helicase [Leptospira sp. GIMC2001]
MIFPEYYPKNTKDFSNESVFHARFKKEMGREAIVYYSVKFITPDVPMREIDFIVVTPKLILCIELKNGKWRYRDSTWKFYNRRSKNWEEQENKPYKGPVDQIRSGRKILGEFLNNHNSFEDPVPDAYFKSCIFFLKNDPSDFPVPDKEKEFFVGKSKLKNKNLTMREIIKDLEDPNLPPLSQEQMKNVNEIIQVNLNFVEDFDSRLNSQQKKLIALTHEQFELLSRRKKFSRTIVLGIPGSGKTIVALEQARRLELERIKTVFITGNTYLANRFSRFRDWRFVHFINENNFDTLTKKSEFLILDSTEEYLNQDFISKLDSILKGGMSAGKWLLFGDFYKSIDILKYKEALTQLKGIADREVVWKENIRTPRKVYEQACILGRKEVIPSLLPDITGIHYVTIESEEEIFQKLSWSIQYGLRELDLEQEEIVILSLNPDLTKKIIDYYDSTKNGQPLVIAYNGNHHINRSHSGNSSVRIADLHEFHGREARFVILIGISDFNDPAYFESYYDALTRTTSVCSIIFPEKLREQLVTLFKKKNN